MAARFTVGPTPVYSPWRPWVWIISLNAENVLLYLGTSPSKSLPWACILTLTRSVGVAMALPMVPVEETFHHPLVEWYRDIVHILLVFLLLVFFLLIQEQQSNTTEHQNQQYTCDKILKKHTL